MYFCPFVQELHCNHAFNIIIISGTCVPVCVHVCFSLPYNILYDTSKSLHLLVILFFT